MELKPTHCGTWIGFIINFSVVYLAKTHYRLISLNTTYFEKKKAYKVKS